MADGGSPAPAPAVNFTLLTHVVEWKGVVPYDEYPRCPAGAYGGSKNPMWQYRNEGEKWATPFILTWGMILVPALVFWGLTISKSAANRSNVGAVDKNFSGRSVYGYTKDQLFSLTLFVSSAAIVNVNIAYAVPGFNAVALLALAVVYFLHDFYTAPNTFRDSTWAPRVVFVQLGNVLIILSLLFFTTFIYCGTVPRDEYDADAAEERGYHPLYASFFFVFFTLGFGLRTCASAHMATPEKMNADAARRVLEEQRKEEMRKEEARKRKKDNSDMFPTFDDGRGHLNGELLEGSGLRQYHVEAYSRDFGPVLILANYEYYIIHVCLYLVLAFQGLAVGVGIRYYQYCLTPLFLVPVVIFISLFYGCMRNDRKLSNFAGVAVVFVFNLFFAVLLFLTILWSFLHLTKIYRAIDDINKVELLGDDTSHEDPDYNRDFLDAVEEHRWLTVLFMSLTTLIPLFGLGGFMFPYKKKNQWGYRGKIDAPQV